MICPHCTFEDTFVTWTRHTADRQRTLRRRRCLRCGKRWDTQEVTLPLREEGAHATAADGLSK